MHSNRASGVRPQVLRRCSGPGEYVVASYSPSCIHEEGKREREGRGQRMFTERPHNRNGKQKATQLEGEEVKRSSSLISKVTLLETEIKRSLRLFMLKVTQLKEEIHIRSPTPSCKRK